MILSFLLILMPEEEIYDIVIFSVQKMLDVFDTFKNVHKYFFFFFYKHQLGV